MGYPTQTIGPRLQVGASFLAAVPQASEIVVSPLAVATTLDSLPIATYRGVQWAIQGWDSTNSGSYTEIITAQHDGVNAAWLSGGLIENPVTGLYDFTLACDISGGNMRLRVTPLSAVWRFNVTRVWLLSA